MVDAKPGVPVANPTATLICTHEQRTFSNLSCALSDGLCTHGWSLYLPGAVLGGGIPIARDPVTIANSHKSASATPVGAGSASGSAANPPGNRLKPGSKSALVGCRQPRTLPRRIGGHGPTCRDFHEKAGRCQVGWVVHNLLFFSCPDSCMVLAGEDRGRDRAFWGARRQRSERS